MSRGRVEMLNGYRVVLIPGHLRAMQCDSWKGYVYEHIVVAGDALGRPLTSTEVVHHLDLNKTNNRRENLLVLEASQHSKLHRWIDVGLPIVGEIKPSLNVGKRRNTTPGYCAVCNRTLQKEQKKYCSFECRGIGKRKVVRPSRIDLTKMLTFKTWCEIAREFKVSDNAVRKWARGYGIIE